jgi:plastocyanin
MRARLVLRRCAVPLLITVLVAAGCGNDDSNSKAASTTTSTVAAPKNIEIGAGVNDPKDPNVAVLQFMPAKVAVAVGTPVTWAWNGTEPHSVTFLKPGTTLPDPGSDPTLFAPDPATGPAGPYDGTTMLNSGLQPLGAAANPFTVSFAKAGTYTYHCVIHPQMVGEIDVVDAGGTVDTPAAVATSRASDVAKYLKEGRDAKAQLLAEAPMKANNADGSTTWTVNMGISTAHTDVLAFSPTPRGVKAGDTVTFLNSSGAPHTASFNAPFQDPTDPRTDVPAPGKSPQTLTATGFYNSGLLPPDAPPGAGPPPAARSFSFKVAGAGTYSYVCLLHAPSGMVGVINAT